MGWTKEELEKLEELRVDADLFYGEEKRAFEIIKKKIQSPYSSIPHEYEVVAEENMYLLPRATNMSCCGMREIATFPCYPKEKAIARLDWIISLYREQVYEDYTDDYGICLIATLSEDQSRWWRILINKGWKEVHSFKNANTGNTVKLFTYDVRPE